ncbi:hypothetical protein BTEBP_170035 [Brochothrix thermosphacta]|nr:hypothetical protein BTEBP_170035 [Brochothrix thermosphacta]
MIKSLTDTVVLNNEVEMPGFGLGVFKVEDGQDVAEMVKTAIEVGYRILIPRRFMAMKRVLELESQLV